MTHSAQPKATAAAVALADTVDYISRLLQGDLGLTTAGSNSLLAIPVSQVIAERLPRSLALGDSLTLGGERECGLYLAGAPRRAALLVRLPEGYRIFNTGPLPSGLKVEGEEVSCSAELRGGERLNVWGQALRFELAPPA